MDTQARTQVTAELNGLAHSLETQLGHGWVKTIPAHLRKALAEKDPDTSPADHGIPDGPIILILYAGPDTHDALDISMQLEAPWITPYILPIDTLRDPKRHDMSDHNLYTHLLRKGQQGEILAIVGGPNCRTWSILLHKPNPDNSPGHPLRGRHEPECWGMRDLTPEEAHKTDMDSTLLLRMLMIYDSAVARGHDPAVARGHDPSSQELARRAKGLNQAVAKALVRTLPDLAHWTNEADSDSDRNTDTIATPTSQPKNDIHVQIGHKSHPLRDGGGKPSPGRRHPMQRTHPLRALGQALTLGTVAGSSESYSPINAPQRMPWQPDYASNTLTTNTQHNGTNKQSATTAKQLTTLNQDTHSCYRPYKHWQKWLVIPTAISPVNVPRAFHWGWMRSCPTRDTSGQANWNSPMWTNTKLTSNHPHNNQITRPQRSTNAKSKPPSTKNYH